MGLFVFVDEGVEFPCPRCAVGLAVTDIEVARIGFLEFAMNQVDG